MATKKHYDYNASGEIIETNDNGMVGWEFTSDSQQLRIIVESVNIAYHNKTASSTNIIQVYSRGKWNTIEIVKANATTNTFRNGTTFATEFESYEVVDDLTKPIYGEQPVEGVDGEGNNIYGEAPIIGYQQKNQLKAGLVNEWDFFYSLFMGTPTLPVSLEDYIKQGASIKAGLAL
jgi:hypothetical protein